MEQMFSTLLFVTQIDEKTQIGNFCHQETQIKIFSDSYSINWS